MYCLKADVESLRGKCWPAITVEGKVGGADDGPGPVRIEARAVMVLKFEEFQKSTSFR